MKSDKRFLISLSVFLFCFTSIYPARAHEKLSDIVKIVASSTVVVLAYGKEGKIINQGSGFFISKAGDIIASRHVLIGANRIDVKTADGKVYPVTQIAAEDTESDIVRASADIPSNVAAPLVISNSIPEEGEKVTIIDNPSGLEQTATDGAVFAVREIPSFGKIIQLIAPISHSLSGSPVINMKGELIGIATSQMLEGRNIRFAVPAEKIAGLKPLEGKTIAEWERYSMATGSDSAEGLYSTGLSFLWSDSHEKALFYFEKAAKNDPRHFKAYFQMGYCRSRLKHYPEAIEAYKQAIKIRPDYADAYYNLGTVYDGLRNYTDAIEAYKQAIKFKPDHADAHFNLGAVYGSLKYTNEAIEAYKQVIRIKPVYVDAHYNLGVMYGKLNRYTEAAEAFRQVIFLEPDDATALYNLGVISGKLNRHIEAAEMYERAIRVEPDYADAYYNLGVIYGKLNYNLEAIEAYKEAIRIEPDYADAYYNMGIIYGKLNKHTEEINAYRQAIAIKPDYALAYFSLGVAYVSINNNDLALEQYKILKDLDKKISKRLYYFIYKREE